MPAVFDGTKKAGDAIDKMRLADGSPKVITQIVPHAPNALRGWDANGTPAAWLLTEVASYATNTLSAVARSGNYVDLANQPVLFDGKYASLTGVPALGTAASQSSTAFATAAQGAKADSALQLVPAQTWASITGKPLFFSGNYADLAGIPAGFDGKYSSLAGTPTLGTAAAQNVGAFATSTQGVKADTALQVVPAQTWASITGKPTIVTYSAATTTVLGIVKQAEALTAVAGMAVTNNSGGTATQTVVALPAVQIPSLLTAAASKASVDAALAQQANNNAAFVMQYNLTLNRMEQLITKLQAAGILST